MLTKKNTDVFEKQLSNTSNQTDNETTLLNEVEPDEDKDNYNDNEEDAPVFGDEKRADDEILKEGNDDSDDEKFDEDEDLEESDEPGGLSDDENLEDEPVLDEENMEKNSSTKGVDPSLNEDD